MTARDQANACGELYDAAVTRQMRQLGDDRLLEMLRKSATRDLVDAWAWDLKRSVGDISGLAAVTNALHGLTLYGQPKVPAPPPVLLASKVRTETGDLMSVGF